MEKPRFLHELTDAEFTEFGCDDHTFGVECIFDGLIRHCEFSPLSPTGESSRAVRFVGLRGVLPGRANAPVVRPAASAFAHRACGELLLLHVLAGALRTLAGADHRDRFLRRHRPCAH